MLEAQLCHIMASNANKYKKQVSEVCLIVKLINYMKTKPKKAISFIYLN